MLKLSSFELTSEHEAFPDWCRVQELITKEQVKISIDSDDSFIDAEWTFELELILGEWYKDIDSKDDIFRLKVELEILLSMNGNESFDDLEEICLL